MFSLVSGVYDSYFAPTQLNLLVVGASGTGKTALLERLKVTQFTKNRRYQQHQSSQDRCEPLPTSFLPLALRQQQQFTQQSASLPSSMLPSNNGTNQTKKSRRRKEKQKERQQPQATQKRRGFLACPAPSKYRKEEDSSSDQEEDEDQYDMGESETTIDALVPRPDKPGPLEHTSSQDVSMEDVSLRESEHVKMTQPLSSVSPEHDDIHNKDDDDDDDDEDQQQHDLLKNKTMLPLHKIRPTIGMNLGKVEICGAKCHVWDLGGKMHDLWSRYYQDCDAVVFVWKIVDDSKPEELATNENDDASDSSDQQLPIVTAAQQLNLLEQVRNSIADDVPFLIWGHWFPQNPSVTKRDHNSYQYNKPYSTGNLLPHYHNPLMSTYFGSSKSGAGVRTAMEWLIPIAARQKKFRDKVAVTNAPDEP